MSRFRAFTENSRFLTKQSFVAAWDWGSAQTRVMVNGQLVWQQPTRVVLQPATAEILAVGERAAELGQDQGSLGKYLVRPIASGVVADLQAATGFAQAVQTELQVRFKRKWSPWWRPICVCALPSSASPVERTQCREVLRQAGFGQVLIVSRARALARFIEARLQAEYLLSLDIGDETTEVVVSSRGQSIWSTTLSLGGRAFTQAVLTGVRQYGQCLISYQTAEKIKHQIGIIPGGSTHLKRTVIRGKQIVEALPMTLTVEPAFFEKMFADLASELLEEIQLKLATAPAEPLARALETGILVVGGGSQLNGLSEYISTGLKTTLIPTPTQPSEVLVQGLSIWHEDN